MAEYLLGDSDSSENDYADYDPESDYGDLCPDYLMTAVLAGLYELPPQLAPPDLNRVWAEGEVQGRTEPGLWRVLSGHRARVTV